MAVGARWPDLDDATAIPQVQGYDFLRNRVSPETIQAPSERARESTAHQQPSSPQSPQRELHIDEHNPFAVMHDSGRLGSDPSAAVLPADNPGSADEPFSFVRELRFAAEVFLAAYLPTAALKLIIVLISMSIVGEPPKSHPFLEMLEAGVSVSMIATILIMAVFVAPIVEELQFRVVVLGGIAQLGWPKLALFGSSILFAFAHGFPDSIALVPLAIGLGYTYLRRRSYVTVMLVHFLFNAFNMVLALVALL
jgi:membrane protease YdiL (CAAX protease family)